MEVNERQLFVRSNKSSSELSLCDGLRKPCLPRRRQVTLWVSRPGRKALSEPPLAQWPPPLPLQDNIRDVVDQLLPKPASKLDHEAFHLREPDAVKVLPLAFELVRKHLQLAILPVPTQEEGAAKVYPRPQLPRGSVGIKVRQWRHWQWVWVRKIRVKPRPWMVQWRRCRCRLWLASGWWIVHVGV
jgi:hypothetical protein